MASKGLYLNKWILENYAAAIKYIHFTESHSKYLVIFFFYKISSITVGLTLDIYHT